MTGNEWAVVSTLLAIGAVGTTVALDIALWWDWTPEDHPGSFYAAQIPWRIVCAVLALVPPVVAGYAAARTLMWRPDHPGRNLLAGSLLILLVPLMLLAIYLGVAVVNEGFNYAGKFPG